MLKKSQMVSALVLAISLAACTTTGHQASQNLSPQQQALRDYSADYTAQGAIAGAAVGCLAGLLISDNKAAGCATGAAVGGLAGGSTGYYVAQRQGQAGAASAEYAVQKNKLEEDVAQANRAVQTSADVSRDAQAEIKQLQRQVASGQASKSQLASRVQEAERDRASMVKISTGLQEKIDSLEAGIKGGTISKSDLAYMKTKRTQLVAEKQKLDNTINDLAGVTAAVAGV
ncbi:YMGG-like glycine zipper-containing protein [Roseomonas genomospecies 6]|uniref:YMGG-like Gly-zipper domain-containing protein n=1 Tax=Roseomonas genomospecies 6 TaxID=214106 RepID=A0A9W7NG70_9PROT|nr:YMGG-like glycine zipper-containing protein [Roseomonas genomospecies 6]KAA0675640.1 hypothetical protein DS843_30680 [Roseomonas genomospecies 6]